MLEKLIIKNVALIENAEINFTSGLNVLSGETGAGKSVILESLNFVLGAKAEKSLIRTGQTECSVSAIFNVSDNNSISEVFEQLDIEKDDTIIISRKFTIEGKNSIKINGNTLTATMLRKISSLLVDVHGQSEHYELLSNTNQLKLIDKLGGDNVLSVKEEIKQVFANYKQTVKAIDQLGGDESQRLVKLDVLNYQINEIESAELYDGEEEKLLELRKNLQHQEKINLSLSHVKSAISEEGGVSDILSNAMRSLSQITDLNSKYLEVYDRLSDCFSGLDDVADDVSSILDEFDSLDYNPDEIESRLDLIKSLKKKYGSSYLEIIEFLEKAKQEKDTLENFEKLSGDLLNKKEEYSKELYSLYTKLSNLRKETSKSFAQNIKNELKELGMASATFNVEFNLEPSFKECSFDSSNGFDNVTFMFSANLGEPLKPLSQVISGGEMSRFMLAIKVHTSKCNDISTFVFDEIDAGISGVVAKIVAQKFARISRNVQVIAITHLPQISSMADNNLLIEKTEINEKTVTNVYALGKDQKTKEIIRLIGGVDGENAVNLANEMISKANEYKNTLN